MRRPSGVGGGRRWCGSSRNADAAPGGPGAAPTREGGIYFAAEVTCSDFTIFIPSFSS
jgi:hypothetical protein